MATISSRTDPVQVDPQHLLTVAELVDAVRLFAITHLSGAPVNIHKVDTLLISAVDTLVTMADNLGEQE